MKIHAEKRACQRHCHVADITFSYFNSEHVYKAEALNFGSDGMCFKSILFLQPGATVCIRLKSVRDDPVGACACEGLRSVTLAEVKWCREVPGDENSSYGVGVKYFAPAY